MSAEFDDLIRLNARLQKISESEVDKFAEACAKELAARLLRKVIKRTPVGGWTKDENGKKVKIDGYVGGNLRRGWTGGKNNNVMAFVNSLSVTKSGANYTIKIINPVDYASYVEYGHRTRNHKGWVNGQFMLTISEKEIQTIAPKLLEARLNTWLGGVLK